MEIVQAGVPFSFNYTAFDQVNDLNVAFNIYDATVGAPSFVAQVIGTYANFGAYIGTYIGTIGKTYLIIGVVYTDNTYLDPDLDRPPTSGTWQVLTLSSVTYLGADYATYDQDETLHLQGSVYRLTSGAPVFVQTIAMTHVAFGVYFGSFTGTINNAYEIMGVVYTDNTFTVVDINRPATCEAFDCMPLGTKIVTNNFVSATLVGQSMNAILVGE